MANRLVRGWKRLRARWGRSAKGGRDSEELVNEHRLLVESVQHYPMPFALYDADDKLVVWNEPYERIYEETFQELKVRLGPRRFTYSELVREYASKELSGEALDRHVTERVALQHGTLGGCSDRHYPGQGWFRVSKHHTPSGAIAGFAIDINELKQREEELMQEVERRKALEIAIRKLANTDEMTGIANRRYFMQVAEACFANAAEHGSPVCLLMIDIDHFKKVNDAHGHSAGDDVIRSVARLIESALLAGHELVGRMGGEEYAVILPGKGAAAAGAIAEKIRAGVEALNCLADGRRIAITVSTGAAERQPGESLDVVMRSADAALYRAKGNGRNRVAFATQQLKRTG